MANTKRGLSILFLVFCIMVSVVANAFADTWTTEVVDANKSEDLYSRAMAVDTGGNLHVVFGRNPLCCVHYDGDSWRYEIVDLLGNYNSNYASIALDTSGMVYISYSANGVQ